MSQKQDHSELVRVTECLDRLDKSIEKMDVEYRGIFEKLYEQNKKLSGEVKSLTDKLKDIQNGNYIRKGR